MSPVAGGRYGEFPTRSGGRLPQPKGLASTWRGRFTKTCRSGFGSSSTLGCRAESSATRPQWLSSRPSSPPSRKFSSSAPFPKLAHGPRPTSARHSAHRGISFVPNKITKAELANRRNRLLGAPVWAFTNRDGWRAAVIAELTTESALVLIRGGQRVPFREMLPLYRLTARAPNERRGREPWLKKPRLA